MSQLQELKDVLKGLRHPEYWLTAVGAWSVVGLSGFFAAGSQVFLNLAPQYRALYSIGCVAIGIVGWYFSREFYWHTGRGLKIGLSFDGHKTPADDWIEIRRELRYLFENSSLTQRVSVRVFPASMTASDPRWTATEKRYKLSHMFRVSVSPSQTSAARPIYRFNLRTKLKTQVTNDFVAAVEAMSKSIASRSQKTDSERDVLRFNAGTMFDVLLFHLAVISISQEAFELAEIFLNRLEKRLSNLGQGFPQAQLNTVRWWHGLCLTAGSRYPGASPPEPDALLSAIEKCRIAVDLYGNQFPGFRNSLARDLFYVKDLEAALTETELAVKAAETLPDRACALLNRSVLLLLLNRPSESATAFQTFFSGGYAAVMKWDDLIGFADFAQGYGFKNAIFMRAMYRKLIGQKVNGTLARQLSDWVLESPDRVTLGTLYHSQLPLVQCNGSGTAVKKSSHPKKKHRKRR